MVPCGLAGFLRRCFYLVMIVLIAYPPMPPVALYYDGGIWIFPVAFVFALHSAVQQFVSGIP